MTDIDIVGILRADNAELRERLSRAADQIRELVDRCRLLEGTVDTMARHVALVLHKSGGSVTITKADEAVVKETLIPGYRTENLEDDRIRFRTLTPEEYERLKAKEEKAAEAKKQGGGGFSPRIIKP